MHARREADACIEQGLVKVDGQTVTALGSRVEPQTSASNLSLIAAPTTRTQAPDTMSDAAIRLSAWWSWACARGAKPTPVSNKDW
ncbi:hypothetical protein JOS77_07945 [Chromobacterium haemolyticum]|nr:hypothetical protein JOS77_07945 [Chromobacterium haemolyticum]